MLYLCSKIILMKIDNKHYIVFFLNIHSMFSQSDSMLGIKTLWWNSQSDNMLGMKTLWWNSQSDSMLWMKTLWLQEKDVLKWDIDDVDKISLEMEGNYNIKI